MTPAEQLMMALMFALIATPFVVMGMWLAGH